MFQNLIVHSAIALTMAFAFAGCDKGDTHAHDGEAAHSHDGEEAHSHDGDAECTCSKGKEGGTVWCDSCNMGYIEGEKSNDKAKVEEALAKK